jgi:hypothetical protein
VIIWDEGAEPMESDLRIEQQRLQPRQGEHMRKLVGITIALFAMAIGPAAAQDRTTEAASIAPSLTTDPMMQIYRFNGLRDSGGAAGVGLAGAIHCTNFSVTAENLRIKVFQYTGAVVKDATFTVPTNYTFTMLTHQTNAFGMDANLATGVLNQGSARIWATSQSFICTASTIDAASTVPYGLDLHGIRFNPLPGTEE